MKKIFKFICLILCTVILFTANVSGVRAAAITVSATSKITYEVTSDTVKLNWKKVSKATGYRVYRIVDGKLKTLKTQKSNKYTVKDLTAGETYKFAVKTYRTQGGKTYWSSKYTSVTIKTKPLGSTPKPKATSTKNTVTLNWTDLAGATGYGVYQLKNDKWVKIKTVTANTYKVSSLKENQTYKFKIRPYAKTSKGTVWGKYSSVVTIQTIDKTKAKFTTPVIGTKGVTLNWGKVPDASAYRLNMLVNGEWVKVADGIKGTSYKVDRLDSDTEYTFFVRAYKIVDGKTKWFTKSDTITIKTKKIETPTTTKPSQESTTEKQETTTKPTTTTQPAPTTTTPTTTTKPSTTAPTTTKPTTTQPTTKPTTTQPTTQSAPYRLKKYKNIISQSNVHFEIVCKDDSGMDMAIEIVRKNGSFYMNASYDGLSVKVTYDKVADEMNLWMGVPIELKGEMKTEMMDIMNETMEMMQVDIVGEITVSETVFNNKSVTNESLYNAKTGYTTNYYFENDTLVGIKNEHPRYSDETIIVKKLTNNIDNKYFDKKKIPFI